MRRRSVGEPAGRTGRAASRDKTRRPQPKFWTSPSRAPSAEDYVQPSPICYEAAAVTASVAGHETNRRVRGDGPVEFGAAQSFTETSQIASQPPDEKSRGNQPHADNHHESRSTRGLV